MSEIADLLVVSTKTVRRIIKLFEDTGDVEPQSNAMDLSEDWMLLKK